MSLSRINAICVKEFRQLSRDRLTFAMAVMIPLVQLVLFGYAINTNVRGLPVGVVDQSQSVMARTITEAVKATQVVTVKKIYNTPSEAEAALHRC